MAIDIEKILTISAKEWFEIKGKRVSHYEARGVHCTSSVTNLLQRFADKVSDKAEIVVEYRISLAAENISLSYACGTALIPKR